MRYFVLMSCFLFYSCSNQKIEKNHQPKPVNFSEADIKECHEYESTVLRRAYREVLGHQRNELVFTSNAFEARELLSKFDVTKGLTIPRANLVHNILLNCTPEKALKFNEEYKALSACSLIFSELSFFQALSQGLNKFPWTAELKLEARKVALDYVSFYSKGDFPLLNRLIALSVLHELSVNQIVGQNLHSDIKIIMEDSQKYVEGLRGKLKGSGLTCESLEVMREELDYSKKVAKQMQELLKRI